MRQGTLGWGEAYPCWVAPFFKSIIDRNLLYELVFEPFLRLLTYCSKQVPSG